jgi:hypothetical protein
MDGHKRQATSAMELGTAIHAMVLERKNNVYVVDANDWKSREAKDARRYARENGKVPLLRSTYNEAIEAVDALRTQLANHADAYGAFANGKPEQTLLWKEPDGTWCRALLDWLPEKGPLYDDLKTTGGSANPQKWIGAHLFAGGYHVQAAFYCRGIRALGLCAAPTFRFVVLESQPPYAVAAVALTPEALAYADKLVDRALAIWRRNLADNRWPAYEPRTHWATLPSYLETQLAEQEEREWSA